MMGQDKIFGQCECSIDGAACDTCTPDPEIIGVKEVQVRASLDSPQEAFEKLLFSWKVGWKFTHPAVEVWARTVIEHFQYLEKQQDMQDNPYDYKV